jgi:hypothetical protein
MHLNIGQSFEIYFEILLLLVVGTCSEESYLDTSDDLLGKY